MKKSIFLLFWLSLAVASNAQYEFEDVINGERFGHFQLNVPTGMGVRSDGRVYISDYGNHQVVIVNPDGSIYKIVKSPEGEDFQPYSIAVDDEGFYVPSSNASSVFVFDSEGNFIRKFGSYGTGQGEFVFANAIAVAPTGLIYIADPFTSRVLAFDKDGNFMFQFPITTTGGYIMSMAFDPAGNLYTTDTYANKVQIMSGTGTLLSEISLPQPLFYYPYPRAIAIDQSFDVYIVDNSSYKVTRVTTPGDNPYHLAGGSAEILGGQTLPEEFNGSATIAYSNALGVFYLAGAETNKIEIFNAFTGQSLGILLDDMGNGQLNLPDELAIGANGNLYVTDYQNNRIQVYDPQGNFLFNFGTTGSWSDSRVWYPYGISIDDDGIVYVKDLTSSIKRYDKDGNFLDYFTISSTTYPPIGAVEVHGALVYVGISDLDPIKVYTKDGQYQFSIGTAGNDPDQLFTIRDIALDEAGNIYAACANGLVIFDAGGNYLKTLNIGTHFPESVTIDPENNIIVSDGYRVFRIDFNGNILEQIGSFTFSTGVSVSGNRLYISESTRQQVLIYSKLPLAAIEMPNMFRMYGQADFFINAGSVVPVNYKITAGTCATVSENGLYHIVEGGDGILTTTQEATAFNRKTTIQWPIRVEKRPLPVMIDSKIREYGDENPELTFRIDPVFFQFDDDLSDLDELPVLTVNANRGAPVDVYPIIVNGAGDNCYSFSIAGGVLIVQPAPLGFQADVKFRTYKTENPELTFQHSPFKNEENLSVLSQLPAIHTTATLESPAGQYPIVVEGAVASNYSITYGNGVLEILKADQQVTIDPVVSPVSSTEDFVLLSATATSGLPVMFTVTNGPAGAAGNEIVLTGQAGTVNVTVLQPGNENYNAASAEISFEVILIMGVDENVSHIKAYPNPVQNELIVQGIEIGQVNLVDSKGSILSLRSELFDQRYIINTSAVPDGLYVLRLTSVSGQMASRKVLIKH